MMRTPEQTELIEKNMKLVHYVINTYFTLNNGNSELEYDDLFQVGCIGLMKAAEKYDKEKGYKFNTFADRVIKNNIIDYLRSCKRQYVVPVESQLLENIVQDDDDLSKCLDKKELLALLTSVKEEYKGDKRKGIEVIEFLILGYDIKKVSEIYNTTTENISKWRYLAKKELVKNEKIKLYLSS